MKNILFIVETNYQLMYATILSLYMKEQNCKSTIISLIDERKIKLESFEFNKIFYVKKLFKKSNGLTTIFEEYSFLRKNLRELYSFNFDRLVIFKDSKYLQSFLINYLKKKSNTKTVLVEEGLSMYRNDNPKKMNSILKFKYLIRRIIVFALQARHATLGFGYNAQVNAIAAYFPDKIDAVKKKNKELIKLPHLPPNTNILANINKIFELSEDRPESSGKNLIFLGQPLSEMSLTSSREEYLFLHSLNEIAAKKNIYINIKPHPKEKMDKYTNFDRFILIKENFIPAELIINKYKPQLLLTWYSSSGVNAHNWWKIETLYLYKLIYLNIDINCLEGSDIVNSFEELSVKIDLCLNSQKENYQINEDLIYEQYHKLASNILVL